MSSEYFSSHFGLDYTEDTEWFDPILGADTKLFLDPFALYKEECGQWASAHDEVIQYFQEAFAVLAPVYDKPGAPGYKKVLHLMTFPEPTYFGLGYVETGQRGAGTGSGFAGRMVEAMTLAIERGLEEIRHFEELALLVERVGRDRISDITCNILMPRFIEYTQQVCSELDIPTEDLQVQHGHFDNLRRRWVPVTASLPRNPHSGLPVLLTPKRFLAELPTLNADDWFDYNSVELRDDYNLDLNERLDKASIVKAARSHPDLVKRWSDAAGHREAQPYDVDQDPAGLHKWLAQGRAFAQQNALSFLTPPKTADEMMRFIEECCNKFRHFVEQGAGWKLLRNDDTGRAKNEESIQLLFKGVIESYCDSAEIRLDREVYLGRGPVDFIFSKTATLRVLLEIKKLSSSSFWDGLESQLTTYMKADKTDRGWYLAVRFGDTPNEVERYGELGTRVKAARDETGFDIRGMTVDARPPLSASKLRKRKP